MEGEFRIAAFYSFVPISAEVLPGLRDELEQVGSSLGVEGLLILATEGINATIAAEPANLEAFESRLQTLIPVPREPIEFKHSSTLERPFRRLTVQVREEIVTLGWTLDEAERARTQKLSPEEWQRMLTDGSNCVVVDTRNRYETRLGMFEGAIDPGIDSFADFPAWVEQSAIPKDATVLMYCTGGIRCEKASLEMTRRGYERVLQLEGGILGYLEQFPEGTFNGECFVFDHRVAVDARLRPSTRYRLCPHCGDPAELRISCARCGDACIVCEACREVPDRNSCTKNCSYHLRGGPKALRKDAASPATGGS